MSETKRKEVCDIISDMLDNPDDCGIYGTSKAFKLLGELLDKHAKEQRERCRVSGMGAAQEYSFSDSPRLIHKVGEAIINAVEK